MFKDTLTEIKKGQVGTGLLVENDGYVSLDINDNKTLKESIENIGVGERNIPYPFIVSAVFQKYGIENANGRIYPEDVLKREVEKYQQRIKDRRAYGECYTPDAECLTQEGWKNIVDVKDGDSVLTLNVDTLKTEYQNVAYKSELEWNGSLISVKNDFIDDLLTPTHAYPLFELVGDGKFKFVKYCPIYDLQYGNEGKYFVPTSIEGDSMTMVNSFKYNEVSYQGKVYCIEVPNHTWYVRQNGKSHWTKNCNHPETSSIDLGRVCMNIIELHWVGRTLVGKMEIPISEGFRKLGIVSTLADMVAQWIISGLRIGVSSRALGSVKEVMGKLVVQSDLELVAWDVVSDNSTPGAIIRLTDSELEPYIESDESKKDKPIIKEDRFTKFENWLN